MLNVSSDQKTTILDPIDAQLQDAFAAGVGVASVQFLAAIEKYTDLSSEQQQLVRDTFKLVVSALVVSLNVKAPLPDAVTNGSGISTFVTVLDGNDFSAKTLVIENGLIVEII